LVNNEGTSTSFVKFKMAAAAMLDSSNRAFFDSMDEFVFKLATFQSNLMKFGQKMKEQHQFCLIQDGGCHHVEF